MDADVVMGCIADVVEKLEEMGVEVWMCTGDNKTTAEAIAAHLGIANVMAETLPAGKFDLIERLQSEVGKWAQYSYLVA